MTSPTPLRELVHPSWADALSPAEDTVAALGDFLRAELATGHGYLPPGPQVLRVFERPLEQVRVLIVGQDPYPTPGHAVGLSFSVAPRSGRSPAAWSTSTPSWSPTWTCRSPPPVTCHRGPSRGCCCSTGS